MSINRMQVWPIIMYDCFFVRLQLWPLAIYHRHPRKGTTQGVNTSRFHIGEAGTENPIVSAGRIDSSSLTFSRTRTIFPCQDRQHHRCQRSSMRHISPSNWRPDAHAVQTLWMTKTHPSDTAWTRPRRVQTGNWNGAVKKEKQVFGDPQDIYM